MSEIQTIITKGEGQQLAFELRIDDKRKTARTLAAFANTSGGKLLIGVKDNGKLKGVDPEEEFQIVEGVVQAFSKPELKFESKVWKEGHHLILEIDVAKSDVKYKALDEEGEWKYYVRANDHTLVSNKILERIWKLTKHGQSKPREFDETTGAFIKIINDESPLRISMLYKKSIMKMTEVDKLLAQLVYWGIVEMQMTEDGTYYLMVE